MKTWVYRGVTFFIRMGLLALDRWWPIQPALPPENKINRPDGISVIIPERDSVELLLTCLSSLHVALSEVQADSEVIVVVNGSVEADYQNLKVKFPAVQWCFFDAPLGFAQAIALGLKSAQYQWVYLLNNDMRLEPDALRAMWPWRSDQVFALASQIHFENPAKRREETGFTAIKRGRAEGQLYDRMPAPTPMPAHHLYAGGGASLFQHHLLADLVNESGLYHPFYWEDVAWGLRAQQWGFNVLFVPTSQVHHHHRATVSRFYSEADVDRMFVRNGLLCQVRNRLIPLSAHAVRSLFHYRQLNRQDIKDMLVSRRTALVNQERVHENDENIMSLCPRPPAENDDKPWVIWVSPFCLSPISHGGARRMVSITRHLSKSYRLALLSDEGWSYDLTRLDDLSHFHRIDLVMQTRPESNQSRLRRIRSHSRNELAERLAFLRSKLQPKAIQIEYEECCALVPNQTDEPHFLTLHDVNHDGSTADQWVNRKLHRFKHIMCCSKEDQRLLNLSHATVVNNGIEINLEAEYKPSTGHQLIFIGPLRYQPNLIAIRGFVNECYAALKHRFPDLELMVLAGRGGPDVAKGIPELEQPGIHVIGHTDEVSQYLQTACLSINPLQNIRGSCIKTLESLASGRICVSSQSAARGLLAVDFSALQVVDESTGWIDTITALLQNPARRHQLERPNWSDLAPFDWQLSAQHYGALYEQ